jgi:hypothetical protein
MRRRAIREEFSVQQVAAHVHAVETPDMDSVPIVNIRDFTNTG